MASKEYVVTPKMSKSLLAHLAGCVFDTPLMVHPSKLRIVLEAIGPRLTDQSHLAAALDALPFDATFDPMNTAGGMGMRAPANNKTYSLTDSGIALIPVNGMLMKKAVGLMSMSGMCTYETISAQVEQALSDPSCRAILLDIDSPGGQTHGAFELSDLIHAARGSKPIYACADDMAASAAYLIASAADKVYVTGTGAVGSIGVYSLHADQEQLDAKMGIRYTYISAGKYKTDGNPHEALSKTAKSNIQSEVDRQYGMFVDAVARNRKLSAQDVVDTNALCFFAAGAVPLLADKVGTVDDAIAALEAKLDGSSGSTYQGRTRSIAATAPACDPTNDDPDNEDELDEEEACDPNTPSTTKEAIANKEAIMPNPVDPNAPAPVAVATAPATLSPEITAAITAAVTAAMKPVPAAVVTESAPAPAAAAAASAPISAKVLAQIADDCFIAGMPQLAAQWVPLVAGGTKTIDEFRAHLRELRVAADGGSTASGLLPGNKAGGPLDQMEQQAQTIVLNSGGKLNKSQAYEKVLMANPTLYRDYCEEKDEAASSPSRKRAYLAAMQPRMAQIGLGTAVDLS